MDEVFDREYIQRKFENMRYLSEAGRTIRKGIDSLFMNLLDETRFFVLDQESSYDENVDRMARALTNQGELDAGFAQRVREREKYSTMVLDQNIAFPHTKNMLPKLTLAMGVFPDMLKDDKYGNIRIIIYWESLNQWKMTQYLSDYMMIFCRSARNRMSFLRSRKWKATENFFSILQKKIIYLSKRKGGRRCHLWS